MAHCYQIEPDGTLTYLSDNPDNCAGYVMITASEYPSVTYWADLAQQLDPGTQDFSDAMTYITGALVTAFVIRVLMRRIAPKL